MKEVGIMTWFKYNNYGTVLQAYALSKKLENMQVIPEIINYRPKIRKTNIYDMKIKFILKQLINKNYQKKYISEISKINEKFSKFRKDSLSISNEVDTYTELKEKADSLDKVVCGSDQIWSPIFYDPHYYLDFVDNDTKKISYAPSFGVSDIYEEGVKKGIEKLLNRFENISVREEQGKEIIKEICDKNVEIVLDPTLLITKEEWIKLFEIKEDKNKDNYILCYFLESNKKYLKVAKELSKKLKVPIKIIPTNNLIDKFNKDSILFDCGPKEFVEYISHAKCVLTDSYHGVLFSINFNKPFVALKRFKENKFSQNSRIINILSRFNLEDRLYNNKSLNLSPIYYKTINREIAIERKKSIDFLRKSIFDGKVSNEPLITNNCTGCGVCAVVCPKKCIKIEKNEEGFWEYTVNKEQCINCGLCKKNCGQVHNNAIKIERQKIFSAYSKSNEVLMKSSSGGLAFELSNQALIDNMPVIGCKYNEKNNRAEHAFINDINNVNELSGSKYLQSYTVDAFEKIKNLKSALIIGTPCQIASIDNYLKNVNKRNEFVLVDLICHGVPSYLVWDKFVKENGSNREIIFRNKKYGWKKELTVGSKRIRKDKFYNYFESGQIYNRCCYDCNYREYMCSDIRLGDFWGKKSNKGISEVIINSEKGLNLFNSIKDKIIFKEENISECFVHQQKKNVAFPLKRYAIINELKSDKKSLTKISNKYCKKIVKDSNFRKKFYGLYKFLQNRQ